MKREILDGATPLETGLAPGHPRLYAPPAAWPGLRKQIHGPGMARWTRSFQQQVQNVLASIPVCGQIVMSGDTRARGCSMATLAMAFRLTGRKRYFTAALRLMDACARVPVWTSLFFGHFAHGFALAYDWMYSALTPAQRRRYAEILRERCQAQFEHYASYRDYHSFSYTCNHLPVVLAGLAAGGGALFGECEGPAAWLRLVREKIALIRDTLGPDGVSPEGIAYGQYYTEFLFKTLAILDGLLGTESLPTLPWCRRYPEAMLYHTLPRRAWTPETTFFQFGDSPGNHWYGPDTMLNRCAAVFRDPHAQWLATEIRNRGVARESANFLNLLWHDPSLAPRPPNRLPLFRHFEDMGLVFMRSGWSGSEAALAFRCGAPAGRHAQARFRHNVAGGHMHPAAGAIQLATGDGPLLIHTGYTRKLTAHASTLLVNGRGQLGEGGEWFEDLEFRKGRPAPAILRAVPGHALDYVLADITAAYPDELGLRRFHRHLLYLKPACWILVDDLLADRPASFEILFHLAAAPVADALGGFRIRRGASTLRIAPLAPRALKASASRRTILDLHSTHESDCLTVMPVRPLRKVRIVTALQVATGNAALPDIRVTLAPGDAGLAGTIRLGRNTTRFRFP
jgi:hypothetical protein